MIGQNTEASSVRVPAKTHGWLRGRKLPGMERYTGIYLWIALMITFSIWIPNLFLTRGTLQSTASEQAIPALLAMAVLIPLSAGVYDLSVGANANLCAILVTVLQVNNHLNMWTAILITLATGTLVGVVNGFLVVKVHIDSFIVTLGSSVVVAAIEGIISGEVQPNPETSNSWTEITQHTFFGFQVVILYVIVVAFLVWWLLDYTSTGRHMYAVGGNSEAARLSGVNVGKIQWTTLTISGAICGLAGVLYGSLNGPALSFGQGLLLPAFAAVFLGSTQVRPGRTNIWGTMIAVVLLATGVEGLSLVTGVQWLNDMFSGVALIVAVGFAVWRQRRSQALGVGRFRQRLDARLGVPEAAGTGVSKSADQGRDATARTR
jgi:ribose transport system permease protein